MKMNGGIDDPAALELALNNIPGVLENGLFVNLTDEVLVGEIVDGVAGVRSPNDGSAEPQPHRLCMAVQSLAASQLTNH